MTEIAPAPAEQNPFDQFDAEETPAERPSFGERIGANVTEGFYRGTLAGAAGNLARSSLTPEQLGASQREAESYRNTDPTPMEGETPLQAQVRAKAARRRAARGVTVESVGETQGRIREELARYEAMPAAEGLLENFTALLGQLGGGVMSPESLVNRVPGVAKLVETFGPKVMGTLGKEIATSAVSQGIVNTVTDPFVQAMSVKAGVQNEFDWTRTAVALPAGMLLGGGMHAAGAAVGNFAQRTAAAFHEHRLRLALDDPSFRAAGEAPDEAPDIKLPKAPEIEAEPVGEGAIVRATDPQGGETTYHIAKTDEGFIVDRARTSPEGEPVEGMNGRLDENGNVVRVPEDGAEPQRPAIFATKEEAEGFVRGQEGVETPEPVAPQEAAPDLESIANEVGDALGVPRETPPVEPPRLETPADPQNVVEAREFAASIAHLPPQETKSIQPNFETARIAVTIPMRELPLVTPAAISSAPKRAELAPVGPFVFEASKLKVDAASMQYKGGGDEFGDVGKFKGVTKWDIAAAGQIMVYQRQNGDMIVANGHQRTSLARRLIATGYADETPVTGLVYREADGFTPSDMRAIAAAENIKNETGTPLDAARIMRERPEIIDGSFSFTGWFAQQALGLARLSDEAFAMVNNGVIPEHFGAVVGNLLPNDPARQKAAIEAIVRFHPASVDQVAILVRRVAEAELVKREAGAQGSMFDDLMSAESTAGEEMKIVDRAIKTLRKDKALFQRVVANAERIEETGSQIERAAAQSVAGDADTFVSVLTHNAYTAGPVRDALVKAARELKNGQVSTEQATREILSALRRSAETDVEARGGGAQGAGDGRPGEPAVSAEAGRAEPGPAIQERQIPDAAAVEPGAEGLPQTLIPGVEPVTDRQRLELQAGKPMQGGNVGPAAGGLFDTEAGKQDVLFRLKDAPKPPMEPPVEAAVAGGTPEAQAAVRSLQQQTFALADTLEMPLRQGRLMNAQAAAQYNNRYGVARVREISDFFSVAHEGGHHLEVDRDIGGALKRLVETHSNELDRMDYDPMRGDPHEGFSEFFALMLTNPAAAQKNAPTFWQAFRGFMGDRKPELLKALDDAAMGYRAYEAAPSGEKVGAQVVKMEGREGYTSEIMKAYKDEGLAPTIGRVFADMYTVMFDDKAPITRAVRQLSRLIRNSSGSALVEIKAAENPDVLLRLWGRSQQGAMHQLRYGVVPYKEVKAQGPSLHDAMALATGQPNFLGKFDPKKSDEFSTYLVAKRADVLWDRYYAGDLERPPVGFSQADARATMAELAKANASFEPAARMVHEFTRNLLRKQYDAGLITKDFYARMLDQPFYVPLYRDVDDKPLAHGGAGGGNRSEGPGVVDTVKRLRGSTRDITDPIQGIMMQTFLVERTIRHNDILRAFKGLADRAGPGAGAIVEPVPARELKGIPFDLSDNIKRVAHDRGLDSDDTELLMNAVTNAFGKDPIMGTMFRMDLASKKGEPILFYKENGELQALRLQAGREGDELYEVLTALPDTISDIWSATMGLAAATLRTGITTEPTFAVANFIRDQLAVGILRNDYIPFFSGVRGVWDELKQNEAAQLYSFLGGVSPGAAAAGTHKAAAGVVDELGRKSYLSNRLTSFHGVLELPALTEAGTRNSVFAKVFEQKKTQGLSPYEAAIEAAYQATDVLDFGRHGSKTFMMRRLVPFYNATMQGLDKARRVMLEPLSRAARGDIITTADKDALTNAGWALFKFAGLGSALGAVYAAINWEREEYRDANAQMKGTHLIVPWGKKILTIPKPFELGLGFTAGEYAFAKLAKSDPRAAGYFMEAVADTLFPPNVIFGNPLIKTTFELSTNRSIFTGRDIVPERIRNYETGLQYTNKTSTLSKWLGEASRDIHKALPIVPELSPMKLDYAIGSLFGMWGKDVQSASNWFAGEDDKPASMFEDYVFLRRFLKDPNRSSEATKQFFKLAAQRGGEYAQAAETFATQFAGKFQDRQALNFLRTLPDEKKAYAILQVGASPDDPYKKAFEAGDRRLHPITRAQAANQALNKIAVDLSFNSQIDVSTGQRIAMTSVQRRDTIEALHQLGAQEMRNALVLLKEPGWDGRPLLDVTKQFEVLRAISPEIAAQVQTAYATAKVLPTAAVQKAWPEVKKLLLRDGSSADLSELRAEAEGDGYEFGGERGKRRRRRSTAVPASP